MDYLPSSYLLLFYGLWTYYACLCSSKAGLPLILLLKNLCFSMSIMWATWALKRGYGHLNKRCHKVILVLSCSISRHSYTSGHIRALWEPCQDWLHSTNPLHGTYPSPEQHSCMEDEDMLVKHQYQKTEIHGTGSPLPYLLTTSLKCSGLRQGYKWEDNGFELAEILPSLGKWIGLMLHIEKLSKDISE